jgi:hypothetical protein
MTGAPFVPSTSTVTSRMVQLANMHKGTVVYDLGSGDGRLLFASAKKEASKVVGLEINPYLVLFTKLRLLFSPYRSVISCRWQNFWAATYEDADIVFVYLLPWKMGKLKRKLEKELKPGTKVVSNSFIFPEWKIVDKDEKNHVYVFTV